MPRWDHHLELGDLWQRFHDSDGADFEPVRDGIVARLRAAEFYDATDIVLRSLVNDLAQAGTVEQFDRDWTYMQMWADQPENRVWLCTTPTKHCPPLPDPDPAKPDRGQRRMSFTMQPCTADGVPINHGRHYANDTTLAGARAWARTILADRDGHMGYRVDAVEISGGMHEFRGDAWHPVRGEDAARHYEMVTRETVAAWDAEAVEAALDAEEAAEGGEPGR